MADKAIKEGKSLLVVATDMDTFLQEAMIQNSREHRLDSCFVKMPHHGRFKDMFIEDVKRILGTSMTCEKVIITKDNTVIKIKNSALPKCVTIFNILVTAFVLLKLIALYKLVSNIAISLSNTFSSINMNIIKHKNNKHQRLLFFTLSITLSFICLPFQPINYTFY